MVEVRSGAHREEGVAKAAEVLGAAVAVELAGEDGVDGRDEQQDRECVHDLHHLESKEHGRRGGI